MDFPGGYCTAECGPGDPPCPDGTECRDLSGLSLCMQSCDRANDCRDEYRCNDSVCDVPCTTAVDCPPGQICDPDGTCVTGAPDCTTVPFPVGCTCADDSDCGSSDCLPPTLGGICTMACTDEQDCGPGLACGVIVVNGTSGLELSTICVPENPASGALGDSCSTDSDCRDTLCYGGRCSEICTVCDAGYDCRLTNFNTGGVSGPLGLCIDSGLSKNVIELGSFPTSEVTGTGDVPFVLPVGSVSLTIIGEVSAPNVCLFPQHIVDPSGTEWYDIFGGGMPFLRPLPGFEVMTVLIPDNDTSPPILDGEWTVSVGTYDCTSFMGGPVNAVASTIDRLAVVAKPYYDGTLDLNLHFTPASGITAASAPGSLWVTNFVNDFWFYYGVSGVGGKIGTVTYSDAPATYNTITSNAAVWAACSELAEPGPGGDAAVNVVVVGGYGGAIMGAAGISGGAPGSFMNDHVPMACATVEALTFSSQIMAVDMSHEVGHLLSMKHTSEFGGSACGASVPENCFDSISDTGQCEDPSPMNPSCPDFDNLMYPALNGAMSGFSAGQENVLSGVPVLR